VGGARWTVRKLGDESDGGHPPSDATFPRPDIAVDGRGSATAVWTADAGQEVVSRLHARGAARWSRTRDLSRGLPGLHPTVAAAPKRGAVAAWTSPVGQRAAAMAARRVGYGAWGAPHVLSAPGVDDTEAAIAVDGAGRAVAGWDRAVFEEDSPGATRSSGWVVQAATMTTRGQWRAPVDLSERGENAGRPVLTLSRGGDGLAAWQRPIGEQGIVVQAAAYRRP
jgi:hypothetical protein